MSLPATSTLSALAEEWSRSFGTRPAVADETRAIDFHQLVVRAEHWAAAFRGDGSGPGSHIALLAGNSVDWLEVAFGAWRAGATLVPLSTFVTARELADVLEHAEIETLVVTATFGGQDFLNHLAAVTPGSKLRRVIVLGREAPSPYTAAADFLRGSGPLAATSSLDPEGTACLLYTSGTTGRPKGVMLSHAGIIATVLPTASRSGLGPEDVMLSSLPLFWVAGLVIRALPTLAAGCCLRLLSRFTADAAVEALAKHRPTALHLRPPQVGQILGHAEFRPELLAAVRRGNGRSEWFEGQLPTEARFITGYGMTEMSGYVTSLDWRDSDETRRSGIGVPLPGVEIRIAGPGGTPQSAGETGEVIVRGPGLFRGYHKEAAGTGLDGQSWFRTGDLGSIDSQGEFRFSGRSKDLLRVKGINVSPLEVEAVLAAHPAVEAAYVVGLAAEGFDQRVVALVVSREAVPDEAALREHAVRQLSHYKRPESYIFLRREDVPLGQTSKPQRGELALLAEARLDVAKAE